MLFPITKIKFLLLLFIFVGIHQAQAQVKEQVHIIIPGGAGGGWDTTARSVGEALSRTGIVGNASYENLSGGDGSKAIAHLIETAERQSNTLMITSTPIILRSLKGIFPQSYKDLTPISSVIADYGAFVVAADSPYHSWNDLITHAKTNPREVNVAGGSAKGSMDHVVAALAYKKSGLDPKSLKYIPYNAGAKALVGLLSGETQVLSTGLSEVLALAQQGEVRILASTAPERIAAAPDVVTLKELNIDMEFTNWRGFFAAPNLNESQIAEFHQMLEAMYQRDEWQKIRMSRGWNDLYIKGDEFKLFLEQQEIELKILLKELGFYPVKPVTISEAI
jgi:putative tricarboxylic transport membrane protein